MKNTEEKSGILGAIIFVAIVLIFLFSIVFLFSGALLAFFGLKYTKLSILIKFFIIYLILDYIIGSLTDSITDSLKRIKGLKKMQINIINFFLVVSVDILLLNILASKIRGIYLPPKTILLFAVTSYFVCYFINKNLSKIDEDEFKTDN